MTLATNQKKHALRSVGFSIVGFIMIVAAGYLLYTTLQQQKTVVNDPSSYDYKIVQKVDNKISYMSNSFFDSGPGVANDAYVTSLTDVINTTIHYKYSASKEANLTYSYDAKVEVRGTYSMKGDSEEASNVWEREFQILAPVTKTKTGESIDVDKSIKIPFAEYKQMIDQFKTTLGVPISGEAIVTFTLRVSGTIDGTRFEDVKASTITVPLDQQIYKLAVKYEKDTSKQVVTEQTLDNKGFLERYPLSIPAVIGFIGALLIIFGFRKKIFKSPYIRELERIYRYYDGIIIKTRKQPDLDGKKVIQVQSFKDMLNLEEEMKTPIVSGASGGESTKFMIIRDDVVYMYQLGEPLIEDSKALEEIERPPSKGRWAK